MSYLLLTEQAADPSAPAAAKGMLYARTNDLLPRWIDENSVVRRLGAGWQVSNTSDVGPTAGADFYVTSTAVPVNQLVAGSIITWRISATKTAACTGTPVFNIRCGTAQSVADTVLATATGVAQTAAIDTAIFEFEAILRAKTAAGTIAWNMRMAHKLATTGFANAAQDQMFNGTSSSFNFTTAGLFMGISINPTNTTANGVWTFQTVATQVFIA